MMKRSQKKKIPVVGKGDAHGAEKAEDGEAILKPGVSAAVADGAAAPSREDSADAASNENAAPADSTNGVPPVEVEDTIESLREKLAAAEDGILRAKADFLNAQRRQEKARQDAVRFANADLMRSLLGVLDDFDRSLEAAQHAADTDAVVEGVRLVFENFMKALRDQGLEEIDAVDQPFDPYVHEAVLMQPIADKAPNTVIEQIAKGYRLHDRVLRPAKVIVSKAAESNTEGTDDSSKGVSGPGVDVDA